MNDYILEMKAIGKSFPGVRALDNVNFNVKKGEIHCLVGENGAGKSTLMKILSGIHENYDGEIVLEGEVKKFKGIQDSTKNGIAIIYQELALIPELSIYENIFFGHEIKNGFIIDWNETILRTKSLLEKVNLDVDGATKIKNIGVGQQQLVEIAKALSKDVKLLILDEPTAALNEDDSQNLLELLKSLKEQGVTSIMISHKLKEVIHIADTVTILKDGKTVKSIDTLDHEITEEEIIKNMVGREIEDIYPKRNGCITDEVAFEIKNWNVYDKVSKKEILKNINIHVKKGEILGIAGLMGSGRTELSLSLFGNVKHYKTSGEVFIYNELFDTKSVRSAINQGLFYVTEDRKVNGLILKQNIKTNITITNLAKLVNTYVINENEEINDANYFVKKFNIKAPSINQKVASLSGGNQQKISLAKGLYSNPKVLILDEPTRGIDVGAKFEIYTLMNTLVQSGMSIIMISSELLEILGMSDRIYTVSSGKVTGELLVEDATEEKVMMLATRE